MSSSFEPNDDLNILFERIHELRKQDLNPFPAQFARSCYLYEVHEDYAGVGFETEDEPVTLRLCGRVMRMSGNRDQMLVVIEDQDTRLHVMLTAEGIGRNALEQFQSSVYHGDTIGFEVDCLYRQNDELTALAVNWTFLSLALLPIPASMQVERQRQERYLHLAGRISARDSLINRSKMMQYVRRFIEEQGFLEISIPFGSGQKSAHDYLQQLLIGGIEKVYTVDAELLTGEADWQTHPQARQLILGTLLMPMDTLMYLTEQLIAGVTQYLHSTHVITWQMFEHMALLADLREKGRVETEDLGADFLELDFTPSWPQRTIEQLLQEVCLMNFSGIEQVEVAADMAVEAGVSMRADAPWQTVADVCRAAFQQLVVPVLIQPTFVVELAGREAMDLGDDPDRVERFALYVNGMVFAEGLAGCNNPMDVHPDDAMREALLYGLPPVACMRLQLDRLGMVMTGATDIRDVIVFPEG